MIHGSGPAVERAIRQRREAEIEQLRTDLVASQRENEQLRARLSEAENDSLSAAVDHAAEKLPIGFHIEICIENGSAWVDLFDDDFIGVEFPADDRSLPEQIDEAIDAALNPTAAEKAHE